MWFVDVIAAASHAAATAGRHMSWHASRRQSGAGGGQPRKGLRNVPYTAAKLRAETAHQRRRIHSGMCRVWGCHITRAAAGAAAASGKPKHMREPEGQACHSSTQPLRHACSHAPAMPAVTQRVRGVTCAGSPIYLSNPTRELEQRQRRSEAKGSGGSAGNGRGPGPGEKEGAKGGRQKKWMVPIQPGAEQRRKLGEQADKRMVATQRRLGRTFTAAAASAQAGGRRKLGKSQSGTSGIMRA